MRELMIDIETAGTAANAPVISIGAVYFNRDTGEFGAKFYGRIDVSDALRYGKMSGDTFKWWLGQSDAARKELVSGHHSAEVVFAKFYDFCKSHGSARPWGNGASFDITILEVAFPRILSKQSPWNFWDVRDCRTIKDLANSAGFEYPGDRSGTHHNSLDDAIFQAEWTAYYWQKLTERRYAELKTTADESDDDLLGDL